MGMDGSPHGGTPTRESHARPDGCVCCFVLFVAAIIIGFVGTDKSNDFNHFAK